MPAPPAHNSQDDQYTDDEHDPMDMNKYSVIIKLLQCLKPDKDELVHKKHNPDDKDLNN